MAWPPISAFPGWGWAAYLLPHLEQEALFRQIAWDKAVEDRANKDVRTQILKAFVCPSDRHTGVFWVLTQLNLTIAEAATNSYAACYGTGGGVGELPDQGNGMFYRNSRTRFDDVTDGLSNTLVIGERAAALCQAPWAGAMSNGTTRTADDAPVYLAAVEEPPTMVMARVGRAHTQPGLFRAVRHVFAAPNRRLFPVRRRVGPIPDRQDDARGLDRDRDAGGRRGDPST